MFNISNVPTLQDLLYLSGKKQSANLNMAVLLGFLVGIVLLSLQSISMVAIDLVIGIFFIVVGSATAVVYFVLEALDTKILPLGDQDYSKFLAACKVTTQGMAYVKTINAMHREYYNYDYDLILNWNNPDTRSNSAAIKELKSL